MEYRKYKLSELSKDNKGTYGIGASAVEYSKDLYTYLRITDIKEDGSLDYKNLKSVYDKNAEKYLLKKGDIVFARTGNSTGKTYYYDGEIKNLVYAGFLIKFSLDENKVNPKFMKYYTMTKEYKNWVNKIQAGSTRDNRNEKIYDNMKVKLPSRVYQDKMVLILECIDKKIELNNQINDNLYELCCNYYTQLYNSNNNDKINLGDLVSFSQGKQVEIEKQNSYKGVGQKRFLRIVDYTNVNEPERYVENYGEKYYVEESDIVMIRYGSQTCGNVVRGKCGIIANNMFKVIPKLSTYKNYIFYFLNSNDVQAYLKQSQNSSTMPSINFGLLNQLLIKDIEKDELIKFNSKIEPLRRKILLNEKESKTLEQLRYTLLPKLMNGEIDLDRIEV